MLPGVVCGTLRCAVFYAAFYEVEDEIASLLGARYEVSEEAVPMYMHGA